MNKQPPDGLTPLPKPIRMEVPRGESPHSGNRKKPTREPLKRVPPPKRETPGANEKGLRHFEQAQRSHGHRRSAPKKKNTKRKQGRYSKEIGIVCLGLICLAFVVFSVLLLTSDNALAVYLGHERIGYLPLNRETREWDASYVQEQAIVHRSANVAAEIRVNEQVRLVPVRANRNALSNATITEVITQVSGRFTYQIVAQAIYVDGQRIAVMQSLTLAEHVKRHFTSAFQTTNTVEATIVGWELRTVYSDGTGLDSPEVAMTALDRRVEDILNYVVQFGDTLYGIAFRHGVAANVMFEDNGLTAQSVPHPGDIIRIRTTRPFLTVRTVEDVSVNEVIPMERVTDYDDELAVGNVNVLSEGRDGERSMIVRSIFYNGVLYSIENFNEQIIVQPQTRHEVVGTLESAAPDWR